MVGHPYGIPISPNQLVEDPLIPGNMIYFEGHSLKTTNGTSTEHLAGNGSGHANGIGKMALFSLPQHILVVNNDTLIIFDTSNDCLRKINRITLMVSDFAGKCTEQGHSDGLGTDARISGPRYGLLDRDQPHRLIYFSAHNDFGLWTVNLTTRAVRTIISWSTYRGHPDFKDIVVSKGLMIWDNRNNSQIIICIQKIDLMIALSLVTKTYTKLQVQKPKYLLALIPLYPNLYLMVGRRDLAVLDMSRNITTVLQTNHTGYHTWSVIFSRSHLYSATSGGLHILPGTEYSISFDYTVKVYR